MPHWSLVLVKISETQSIRRSQLLATHHNAATCSMVKLLRMGSSFTSLTGDVLFDVTLVVGTMGGAWFCVRDPIAKIPAEVALGIANVVAISFYYYHPKSFPIDKFKPWFLSLMGALVVAFIFMRFEPIWESFFALYMSGYQEKALSLLDTHPHGNLPMFVGLFAGYASLIGLIRLMLKRLFKILYPSISKLRGRDSR